MSLSKVSSASGSTAIGGDSNAPAVNVNTGNMSPVNIVIDQKVALELPSFLGNVIALFSQQSLSEYGRGARRAVPPEVIEKLQHNNLDENHHILVDYYRHSLVLEKAYLGVEQQNADSRYLVRRKVSLAYSSHVQDACIKGSIAPALKLPFIRANAAQILEVVIERLLSDYKASSSVKVEQETANLAISLIVADAVIECEVLERPLNALTT
jgi:hypothetical protein